MMVTVNNGNNMLNHARSIVTKEKSRSAKQFVLTKKEKKIPKSLLDKKITGRDGARGDDARPSGGEEDHPPRPLRPLLLRVLQGR